MPADRLRRIGRCWVACLAIVVAPGASAASPVLGGADREPDAAGAPPLAQLRGNEVLVPAQVTALAVGGSTAAFFFCDGQVEVWRWSARSVVAVGSNTTHACPAPTGPERVLGLGVGNGRVAWSVDTGGNTVDNIVFAAATAHPSDVRKVYQSVHCCRAAPSDLPDQNRVGPVYGDGSLLVFGTSQKCGDPGAQPCVAGAKPSVVARRVWRIVGNPPRARCLGTTSCASLTAADPSLEIAAAGGSRVALRRSDGALVVADGAGRPVRTFASAVTPETQVVMGDDLVVTLAGSKLVARPISTGRPTTRVTIHSREPQLLDVAAGLVVYRAGDELHLLRLADGRDRVLGVARDARFGSGGLFYSYDGSAPWPGRVRFVPWANLPLHP